MITNDSMKIGSEPPVQSFGEEPVTQKHSGLGIASFIISIVQSIGSFLVIASAGVVAVSAEKSGEESEVALMIIGFLIIGAVFVHLTGLALGIAGAVQKDRKKLFAVLGLVINAVSLAFIGFIMLLGMALG